MLITLNNSQLEATIETFGAELTHLKKLDTGLEYMWNGDPTFWTGRSPILFPTIGKLKNDKYNHQGKTYTMANHGFARKQEFQCISQTSSKAIFRLTESKSTLAQYPFNFILDIIYTIFGDNLQIQYVITNTSKTVMPFQIGAHPAFNCPLGDSKQLSDWYIEFDENETLSRIAVLGTLIDLDNTFPIMDNTNILELKSELFYDYAIVFTSIKSKKVTLKSDITSESIAISFSNLPDLTIWQPKNAPFLCIEPWYGHGDIVGFTGDLMDKEPMIHLDINKTHTSSITITFN